jgi:hypothetical protein
VGVASCGLLVRGRLWLRSGIAELAYSGVEYVFGSERNHEQGVPRRGGDVSTRTLQLRSLLRGGRTRRALADRCGQPLLRLWATGVDVNVTSVGAQRLVEFPGGRVLTFDVEAQPTANCVSVVLAESSGPRLVLW